MASENDYPSAKDLRRIKKWPSDDIEGCLDFARSIWHWGEEWANEYVSAGEAAVAKVNKDERCVRFATGGWSGNEDIIGALNQNVMVRALCWRLSARGGLHIYSYPPRES